MAPRKTPGTPKTRARANARRDWTAAWLEAFADAMLVTEACKVAQVGRSTVYKRREDDGAFAAAWREIEDAATERLEREAYRRAHDGVERDVFYKGDVVGREREFSDTLTIFLLKARKPAVYRENVRVEHSGPDGGPVRHELDVAVPKVRDLIDQALAAAQEAERAPRRD